MAISKAGKTLIGYNVKNGQYATFSDGVYGTPASMTWLTKFSKEKNLSTKEIFGDGELQLLLVNDKGYTGTIGMTARDEEYEEALGFIMNLGAGTSEIQQLLIKEHAVYFESDYMGSDGDPKVKKTWVFGVTANSPSETYDQNTEDINQTNVEYPLTIRGAYLKQNDGATDYVNANGEKAKVFTYSKKPTDFGYATFGDAVPVPKITIHCIVTFAPIDSSTSEAITGATIVVKKATTVIAPETNGTYKLVADTYTYDISAEGYVTQTDVELVISSGDATTGIKTVAPELVAVVG